MATTTPKKKSKAMIQENRTYPKSQKPKAKSQKPKAKQNKANEKPTTRNDLVVRGTRTG